MRWSPRRRPLPSNALSRRVVDLDAGSPAPGAGRYVGARVPAGAIDHATSRGPLQGGRARSRKDASITGSRLARRTRSASSQRPSTTWPPGLQDTITQLSSSRDQLQRAVQAGRRDASVHPRHDEHARVDAEHRRRRGAGRRRRAVEVHAHTHRSLRRTGERVRSRRRSGASASVKGSSVSSRNASTNVLLPTEDGGPRTASRGARGSRS